MKKFKLILLSFALSISIGNLWAQSSMEKLIYNNIPSIYAHGVKGAYFLILSADGTKVLNEKASFIKFDEAEIDTYPQWIFYQDLTLETNVKNDDGTAKFFNLALVSTNIGDETYYLAKKNGSDFGFTVWPEETYKQSTEKAEDGRMKTSFENSSVNRFYFDFFANSADKTIGINHVKDYTGKLQSTGVFIKLLLVNFQ